MPFKNSIRERSRIEIDQQIIKQFQLALPSDPSDSYSDQSSDSSGHNHHQTLSQICLSLLSHHFFNLILHHSPNQASPHSQPLAHLLLSPHPHRPPLAPHLINALLQRCSQLFKVPATRSISPDVALSPQLPFLLYSSILAFYKDPSLLGFRKPSEPLRGLVLEDRLELAILQSTCPPNHTLGGCLTIVNLSWYNRFDDSDLLILRERVGISVALLRLDFTSVTDHGIAHLARGIEEPKLRTFGPSDTPNDPTDSIHSSKFCQLRFLSLKGLKGVTDRSMLKLSRFPSMIIIDLNQTSCTQASRAILNRSIARSIPQVDNSLAEATMRQFRHPQTDLEKQLFSGNWTLAQKLVWLIDPSTKSSTHAIIQIDWICRSHFPRRTNSSFREAHFHQHLGFHRMSTNPASQPQTDPSLCLILEGADGTSKTLLRPSKGLPTPMPLSSGKSGEIRLKRKLGISISGRLLASDLDELFPKSQTKKTKL